MGLTRTLTQHVRIKLQGWLMHDVFTIFVCFTFWNMLLLLVHKSTSHAFWNSSHCQPFIGRKRLTWLFISLSRIDAPPPRTLMACLFVFVSSIIMSSVPGPAGADGLLVEVHESSKPGLDQERLERGTPKAEGFLTVCVTNLPHEVLNTFEWKSNSWPLEQSWFNKNGLNKYWAKFRSESITQAFNIIVKARPKRLQLHCFSTNDDLKRREAAGSMLFFKER